MRLTSHDKQKSNIDRLLVYFFWDADGVVDDYIPYALKALSEHSSETLVVINGEVNKDGYEKLKACSDKLIIRENTGLDAWAYKASFEHLGYEYLEKFDEVLVTNFTLYGPIFPLSSIFDRMDVTPCDFWGLAGYNQKLNDGSEVNHIQSFFVSYRKSLVKTQDFRDYWENLPEIKTYIDSVKLHELTQTPYFTTRGYTFESWISQNKYSSASPANFIITCADRVLVEDRCPMLKRRAIFFSNGNFEPGITIQKIEHISNFIKTHSDYDISMILNNAERTQKVGMTKTTNNLPHANKEGLQIGGKTCNISKFKYYRKKIKSWIHPSRRTRRHLSEYIKNIKNPHRNISQLTEYPDCDKVRSLFERYLTSFKKTKPNSNYVEMWIPPHQHVGKYTYAAPDLQIVSVGTVIGSFCSIGQRVVIGHGKHPKDFLSTSPYFYFDELGFKHLKMPNYDQFWYIEPVIIGNDVWIGDGAWIANGITIGNGAIIGARSVVTKDVPPYAIVAGSPARILRYRFDSEIVEKLMKYEWWNLSDEEIRQIPFDDILKATEFLSNIIGGNKDNAEIDTVNKN